MTYRPSEVAEQVLEDLGQAAREEYRICAERLCRVRGRDVGSVARRMRGWDAGEDGNFGTKRKDQWQAIAKLCLEFDVPIGEYVFSFFSSAVNLPGADNMARRSSVANYSRDRSGPESCRSFNLRREMSLLEAHLATRVGPNDKPETLKHYLGVLLANPMLPLTPLFRLCVASRVEEADLVHRWLPQAVAQYGSCSESMRKELIGWVPAVVVEVWEAVRSVR